MREGGERQGKLQYLMLVAHLVIIEKVYQGYLMVQFDQVPQTSQSKGTDAS